MITYSDIQVHPLDYYKRESKILSSMVPEDLYELFKSCNVYLAGGSITSIFTNKEVNDLDLYFTSYENFEKFYLTVQQIEDAELNEIDPLSNVYKRMICEEEYKLYPVCLTEKSITFTGFSGRQVQCILFNFPKTPEDLFKSFDFSVNMGLFDFSNDCWVFHKDFLKHNAQNAVVINPYTSYPIVSLLRIYKYIDKGYSFSKKELLKLSVGIANLNFKTWEEVKTHFSGMYGEKVTDIFNDLTLPCNMENIINKVEEAEFQEKNNETDQSPELLYPYSMYQGHSFPHFKSTISRLLWLGSIKKQEDQNFLGVELFLKIPKGMFKILPATTKEIGISSILILTPEKFKQDIYLTIPERLKDSYDFVRVRINKITPHIAKDVEVEVLMLETE